MKQEVWMANTKGTNVTVSRGSLHRVIRPSPSVIQCYLPHEFSGSGVFHSSQGNAVRRLGGIGLNLPRASEQRIRSELRPPTANDPTSGSGGLARSECFPGYPWPRLRTFRLLSPLAKACCPSPNTRLRGFHLNTNASSGKETYRDCLGLQ
jgi:hypothetical protein